MSRLLNNVFSLVSSNIIGPVVIPCLLLCYAFIRAWAKLMDCLRTRSLIQNLPSLSRGSLLTGNLGEIYDVRNIQWHHEVIGKYGGALKVHGILGDEQIYFTDPLALHHIILKDQQSFVEPESHMATNGAILGEGLLATVGEQHRKQRKILNPVFSIKHMRCLIPLFCRISMKAVGSIENRLKNGPPEQEINMLEWLARLALELVGQGGIGHSFDTLADGEKCRYSAIAKDLNPALADLRIPLMLLPTAKRWIPRFVRKIIADYLPIRSARTIKSITDFIEATSKEVLEKKKPGVTSREPRSEDDSGSERSIDMLSVLLEANEKSDAKDRLTDSEVIGQITTIVFAAQDTTSSAMVKLLSILSENPHAQSRLRDEIRNARHGKLIDEEWSYDELNNLPYLDAVCRETLRMHPPTSWFWRTATRNTTVPLLRHIKGTDGEIITSVPIAKNQGVIIGVAAVNRDERTWGSDGHKWRPERWLSGGPTVEDGTWSDKKNDLTLVKSDKDIKLPGVYSGMMTFSGGSRACIGFKFSLLELKVVLATMIDKFQFAPSEKEIVWHMTNIQTPYVKGHENKTPHLPLIVSLAE